MLRIGLTIFLILFLKIISAFGGDATLSWDAPTTNVDGSPLTDLDGYKVYYGTASGSYSQQIDVGDVTTYTVLYLSDGITYYFAVTAYDTSGNESGYSNGVSKFISNGSSGGNGVSSGGGGCGSIKDLSSQSKSNNDHNLPDSTQVTLNLAMLFLLLIFLKIRKISQWRFTMDKKLITLIFILGLGFFIFSSNVEAVTYYVDYVTGNDNNPVTSQSSPWRHSPGMAGATGTAAATTLQPGDIVYFKKGVIWPSAALPLTPGQSGTATNPITYKAKSDWGTGDYAIFDAEYVDTHAFDLDNYNQLQYLVLEGVWLRNSTGPAYFNRSSPNQTVRNFKITGVSYTGAASTDALYAGSPTTIENCVIDGNGVTHGVHISWTPGHIVRGCDISNAYTGIRFDNYSHNGIIEKNYIHNISTGGMDNPWGIIYRSSITGIIRYNIIDMRGVSGDVRAITSWLGGSGPYTGHKIYNNVLIGGGVGAGFLTPSPDYDGFYFANNIFYNFDNCIDSLSDATITNNIFYGCNTNWAGSGSFTTGNNITANPNLVNVNALPSGAQLQSNSSAIDAGVVYDGYHNGVRTDFGGYIVPWNLLPDIGAFEYGSTLGQTDTIPPASPLSLRVQ